MLLQRQVPDDLPQRGEEAQKSRALSYGPTRGPLGRSDAAHGAASQVAERLRTDAVSDEEWRLLKLQAEVGSGPDTQESELK